MLCSWSRLSPKLLGWSGASWQRTSVFRAETQAGLWSDWFAGSKLTGCWTDRGWTIALWPTGACSMDNEASAEFGKWTLLLARTEGWWDTCVSAAPVCLCCSAGAETTAAASWMKVGSVCNLKPRERLLLRRFGGRPKECWTGSEFRLVAGSTTDGCWKEGSNFF